MAQEGPDPTATELLSLLPRSPGIYPQKIDVVGLSVLLLALEPGAYLAASFLDDRMLGPQLKGAWVSLDEMMAASSSEIPARPLHFIFHTGHVGSTLVSRLLDETGSVLSLREPLPLRTFADVHDALAGPDSLFSRQQFEHVLNSFLRLWSRGYEATHSVIVKATSSAGRLAVPILARAERSRAIYLNLRPEPYLTAVLAGQNSIFDLRGHGPERMRRLQARLAAPLPCPLYEMSPGQLAALSWLAESWCQREAGRQFGNRVFALDFDVFLSAIDENLDRILRHFELPGDDLLAAKIARSPVLMRYSKAPEYAFTREDRAEMLRESRSLNREEIRQGMHWLERLAGSDGTAAEIISAACADDRAAS
jgi:hypothetical protein